jgi:hypothetical protein
MSLRKSPRRTSALLVANRANSRKSTGPRTDQGKARVSLNRLKHGQHAGRSAPLRERLVRAGYHHQAALYDRVRSCILEAFGSASHGAEPTRPEERRAVNRLAAKVWSHRRFWGAPKTKPECALDSSEKTLWLSTRIGIHDYRRRIGMVFWAQHRRYFTWARLERVALDLETPAPPEPGTPAGDAVEEGIRCLVFRLAKPRFWERLRFCLDKAGRYHPELEEGYRRQRARLRQVGLGYWLQPNPLREAMTAMGAGNGSCHAPSGPAA